MIYYLIYLFKLFKKCVKKKNQIKKFICGKLNTKCGVFALDAVHGHPFYLCLLTTLFFFIFYSLIE